MNRITQFVLTDIFRNKIMIAYTALLAVFSWSAFTLENNSQKGLLTLLNIILLTVPLVSVLFSTIYIYNSSEFIELLVSQPIKRGKIWFSIFTGLSISLALAFLLGAGVPLLLYASIGMFGLVAGMGVLVSVAFTAIAFFSAIFTRDKAKGIGISVLLWLYFALLFDGLVLFLLFQFADYPIENAMVFITALSPIDLARILILLQLDISAMMGYTGAIFKQFFGTALGFSISVLLLCLWTAIPFALSLYRFQHKDL
ncbi:MAG TPA: ABC transporter permease subunit [Chitinophagales bacterium]|nr:ABC transporter permease subunit [Chitinophagales bacterium]HRK27970.1 ABC transporter permease subunit [Chitinophagales bacterium]